MEIQNQTGSLMRIGECRQCGKCCRRLGWIMIHADDETLEWIRAHDPDIRIEPDPAMEGHYWMSTPYKCSQLIETEDGKFICKMHENKPEICKRYPESTDDLKPGCGYFFFDPKLGMEGMP